MIDTLQVASYEGGTASEKFQASCLPSEGMTPTVCEQDTSPSLRVLVTLEDWILETGIKKLQSFIVKHLPLTGASKEDREDLAQEVLCRLHYAYGRVRKSLANWWGLLKPTIRYTAIDFLRYQLRRVKLSAGIEAEAMDRGNCARTHWTRTEMIEELRDLKKKGCTITDEDIEIVVLKLYDKATLAEIARTLGYKGPSGVHPRFHAAIDSVVAFRMATSDASK